MHQQFVDFFSEEDWQAHKALQVRLIWVHCGGCCANLSGETVKRVPGMQSHTCVTLTAPFRLCYIQAEMDALREDVAPTWLAEPLSLEETAERYVRPALRNVFVDLCQQPVSHYLDR
jgi:hypothetical protein